MKEGRIYKELGDICEVEYGTRVVQARDGGSVYPVLWENEDPITPEDYVIYKESELEE